jgi:hypothetical protein
MIGGETDFHYPFHESVGTGISNLEKVPGLQIDYCNYLKF